MVGGPNVCPEDAPGLEKVFALVLASKLAFWSSIARYIPVGRVRETTEKELILCNLVARKASVSRITSWRCARRSSTTTMREMARARRASASLSRHSTLDIARRSATS